MPNIPVVPRRRSIANLFRFVQNPINVLDRYTREYGPTFEIFMGGTQRALISSNPSIIRHVLQKNHRNYKKSPVQTDILGRFVGKGLLTSDGPYWLQQRRLIQPGFHRDKLASLTGILNEVIQTFFDQLDRQLQSDPVVDLTPHMMELAFLAVTKSLFSTSVNESELGLLGQYVTQLQEFVIKQVRMPFLNPWFRFSGSLRRHDRIAADSKKIVMEYILERKKDQRSYDDLFDMLLTSRYEDTGEGMTDQQLLDESLILFVAGHETTAIAMSWTGYLLTQHPRTVDRLRDELKEVVGNRPPGFSDLPKLTYHQQVIEESMRLYPPAWITDRVALEADEVEGCRISKGKLVVPYIYGVHREEQLWKNPDQFDPGRFAKANKKEHPSFAYLPFGGGPRLCIGNNFAMMEMQLILAEMVRRYELELAPGQEISLLPLVTLRSKHGVQVLLHKRSQ